MIQYLAIFLSNLSNDLAPVRALTKTDVPFVWNEGCEAAFKTVKNNASEMSYHMNCYKYFDLLVSWIFAL